MLRVHAGQSFNAGLNINVKCFPGLDVERHISVAQVLLRLTIFQTHVFQLIFVFAVRTYCSSSLTSLPLIYNVSSYV
jgi:hypothetical protein